MSGKGSGLLCCSPQCMWHSLSGWFGEREANQCASPLQSRSTWGWAGENGLNCRLDGGGCISRKGRGVQSHPTHLMDVPESGKIVGYGGGSCFQSKSVTYLWCDHVQIIKSPFSFSYNPLMWWLPHTMWVCVLLCFLLFYGHINMQEF